MNPILGVNTFGCSTTDQNHRIKNCPTNTMSQPWKCVNFSLHERNFSLHESAWTFLYMKETFLCMKVRELFSTWKKLFSSWKCVNFSLHERNFYLHESAWTFLYMKKTFIFMKVHEVCCTIIYHLRWVGFHQVQHMYHNANNIPLWTWWQQQPIHSPPLTSRAKGEPRYSLS